MLRPMIALLFVVTLSGAKECPSHYPSGKPQVEIDQLLCKQRFAIGYSYTTQSAVWGSEVIRGEDVVKKAEGVRYRFRQDDAIPELHRAAGFRDCTGRSVYERGQLVPYEDVDDSVEAAYESFLLSNIAAQLYGHNAKGWKSIEKAVRALAVEHETVEVVTGVLFDYAPEEDPIIVGNGVMVPTHWYKAVYAPNARRMWAWLTPHRAIGKGEIGDFRCSVDAIEKQGGIDLFSELPELLEAHLESQRE